MTDYAARIAGAAGDPGALLALAIELATAHAAAASELATLKQTEAQRRRATADRQQRRRNEGSRDVTQHHVTSRDVTQHDVTARDVTQHDVTARDVTNGSLGSSSPTPLITPNLPTHTRESAHEPARHTADSARNAGEISVDYLQATLPAGGMFVVEEYLAMIGTRNHSRWYVELHRMIGPATGIEPDDLVQGLRDAMIVEPVVNKPGPLETFVRFRKTQRVNAASDDADSAARRVRRGSGGRPTQIGDAVATAVFGQIRALISTRDVHGHSPVTIIPKDRVQALGPRAFSAYEQVGGAERFIATKGEKIGLLLRDFNQAFAALPPDEPADTTPQPVRMEA